MHDVAGRVEETVRGTRPWIRKLARLGFLCDGIVYIIVGFVAAHAAVSSRGATSGWTGALESLLTKPFGRVILAVIALGLLGYAAWCIVAGLEGAEGRKITDRVPRLIEGVVYALLAFQAVRLAIRSFAAHTLSDDQSSQHLTATLLGMPAGRLLGIAIGIALVVYAVVQLVAAFRESVTSDLDQDGMSPESFRAIVTISRIGIAARAFVLAVMGWFVFRAAMAYDPSRAKGIAGALRSIGNAPFGTVLLLVVSVGLIAYGIREIVNSRYRRIVV